MGEINEKNMEPVAKTIKKKNFGFLGTLMEDGSPHVSPVWIDILINTAKGRTKQKTYLGTLECPYR
jgi:hypothetical protein